MIWFDLDNSPHVQIFQPIFKELEKQEEEYFITARDYAQTVDLLDYYKIPYTLIGRHGGKNKIKKVLNLLGRSYQLYSFVRYKDYSIAISHGSRSQLVANTIKNKKSILMFDYEYTESRIFNALADYLLVPKFIPDERLEEAGFNLKKIIKYNGFKEELYLSGFQPDHNFRKAIEVDNDKILVVLRPPSIVSNYHNSLSEKIMVKIIKHFINNPDVIVLVIPRTNVDEEFIKKNIPIGENIRFLKKAVDGLQLVYAANIFISGGGTMNREAALLGTTTYSIFTGRRPYLDEYLSKLNRLQFISDIEDISKINFNDVSKKPQLRQSDNLVNEITRLILQLKNQ